MKFSNLKTYHSAFDALADHFDLQPGKDGMTEDEYDTLQVFDAFDGMVYTIMEHSAACVKHSTVIVSDGAGNVMSEMTLDEFMVNTMEYIRNEVM